VELPSGVKARMFCRPVRGEGGLTGGVVHVKIEERLGVRLDPAPAPRMFLPGLVGSGGLWLRGCHQVKATYATGEWLALEGEAGVGKLAVVRAVHQHEHPGAHFAVADAALPGRSWLDDVRRELRAGEGALVIQHADQANGPALRSLCRLLERARTFGTAPWVAITLSQHHDDGDLLRFFPSTVELPPLRYHLEDVQALVPFFLAKLVPDGRLECSPAAMQMLSRSSWPGNIEQLWQVLRNIVQHRRSGAIQPRDLPPECRTVSRRLLSPLEAMERDAIVRSLLDWDGNKVKAAAALGMSRATIYRKIHEYGIVAPAK
jgi:transcriptional regulator with AAA-type ATPase domain